MTKLTKTCNCCGHVDKAKFFEHHSGFDYHVDCIKNGDVFQCRKCKDWQPSTEAKLEHEGIPLIDICCHCAPDVAYDAINEIRGRQDMEYSFQTNELL